MKIKVKKVALLAGWLAATNLAFAQNVLVAPVFTEAVGTSPQEIRIKFNEANVASNHIYEIYFGTSPTGPFNEDTFNGGELGNEITYQTSFGYEANTLVYFKVAAVIVDEGGYIISKGPFTDSTATTMAGWPPSPTDFAATFEIDHIKLTWIDHSTPDNPLNETSWGIMRADDGGVNFNHAWRVPADTTVFFDYDNIEPNHKYVYRLESINQYDNSYDVYFVTIITPPTVLEAPVAKLASFVTATSFIANWKPVDGADRYVLDVYDVNKLKYFLQGVMVHDTTFSVTGTKSYRRYSYVVRAAGYGIESSNSNTILVTRIKNLILKPVCSDTPDVYRRWEVINNNIVAVQAWWHVNNTNQYGSVLALPGSTYFTTQRISGTNKTTLSYYDDEYILHTSIKGSPFKPCSNPDAREYTEEDLATEARPFTIQAFPNPMSNKFRISINSLSDSDVDIKILNLQGIQVYAVKAVGQSIIEIDASKFARGIYLIRALQSKDQSVIKVFKE